MYKGLFFGALFGLFGVVGGVSAQVNQIPEIVLGPVSTPTTFNTDSGSQQITISFDVSDDNGVCVTGDSCNYPSYARVEDSAFTETFIRRVGGDKFDGSYEVDLVFAKGSTIYPYPQYADNDLKIYDISGVELRVPITEILINTGTLQDTAPPTVEVVSVEPQVVTNATSRLVTITMNISDDISGICAGGDSLCQVDTRSGVSDPEDILEDLGISFSLLSFDRVSGDQNSGTYEMDFYVPYSTPHGRYDVGIDVVDNAGNYNDVDLDGVNQLVVSDPLVDEGVRDAVHRFYSEDYRSHFYTVLPEEANEIIIDNPNWDYEGISYTALLLDSSEASPLYRFYSDAYQSHFYTNNAAESASLITNDLNWRYEGTAYYVYFSDASDRIPVYRFYSDTYKSHFYTTNESEKNSIEQTNQNWMYEGIAWYVSE